MEENSLFRTKVHENFKILSCSIKITLDQKDYHSATYRYSYKIQKLQEAKDEWREVFAYKQEDLKMLYAKPTYAEPDNGKDGLQFKESTLNNPSKNACISIAFDKKLKINDPYEFSYKCVTKIEALSNVHRFFGGDGVAWYWIAHEYKCEYLDIEFEFPPNLTVKDTHPDSSKIKGKGIHFENKSVGKFEFVPTLVTYEQQFLGLSPVWGKRVQVAITFIVGALVSLGVTELYNIYFNQ